jgi:hypothetical protein
MDKDFFPRSVVSAFDRILSEFGFSVVESDDSAVELASSNMRIYLTYDWRHSYELEIGFYQIVNGTRTPTIPYNLGEVFRECNVPDNEKYSYLQSSKQNDVVEFLINASQRLVTHCQGCLTGGAETFEAIAKRRSWEASEYTHKVQLASVRERADAAWRNKSYREFVDLLEEFAAWLPDSDREKFEYAVKKCAP